MPKKTFYHLPQKKKDRILNAARQEFFRVPYQEASINQIIKNADIPRGSFYQYFVDKKDLFSFLFLEYCEAFWVDMKKEIQFREGDFFSFLDWLIEKILSFFQEGEWRNIRGILADGEAFHIMWNKMIESDDYHGNMVGKMHQEFYQYIDCSLLELEDQEELESLISIVIATLGNGVKEIIFFEECSPEEVTDNLRKRIKSLARHYSK